MGQDQNAPVQSSAPPWSLAAIMEVDPSDRVQCQCNDCGQGVYKRIHMIVWRDGRIECWGSECFKREMGSTPQGRSTQPLYPVASGQKLTDAQRTLLAENRERLIEDFRAQQAEVERAEREDQAKREAERAEQTRLDAQTRREEEERVRRAHFRPAGAVHRADSVRTMATVARGPSVASPRSLGRESKPPFRPGEPKIDPAYLEIRNRLVEQWWANGLDPTFGYGLSSLVENAMYQYRNRRSAK